MKSKERKGNFIQEHGGLNSNLEFEFERISTTRALNETGHEKELAFMN